MQFASTVAIGFVAIANVNAVLSMISNAPTREMVPVAPLVAALMQFLLPSYLTARHLSSTWERHFRHGFIRAAAFTRATLTLSFAAMSAIFFIACHRASGSASGFDLWRLWLPKWLFVVACSYAAVPAPNAACALAGVLADLLAAKAAFFYLATPGTPEMDQKTQLYTCAGMYLASLHLFDVSNFLYKTAVSRLGLRAENTSTPETTRAATLGSPRPQLPVGPLEDGGLRDRPGEVQARAQEVGSRSLGRRPRRLRLWTDAVPAGWIAAEG